MSGQDFGDLNDIEDGGTHELFDFLSTEYPPSSKRKRISKLSELQG